MPTRRGHRIDTDALEPDEYSALREALRPEHWRVFYDLLWHSGIREGEALALYGPDIIGPERTDGPAVTVRRLKRRKVAATDNVPIPSALAADLIRLAGLGRGPVFGKNAKPYSAAAAFRALKAAARRAGLRIGKGGESSIHPHLYRHGFGRTFATLDLRGAGGGKVSPGDHLALLGAALGHAGGSTRNAEIYFRPSDREVRRAMRQAQDAMYTEPPPARQDVRRKRKRHRAG